MVKARFLPLIEMLRKNPFCEHRIGDLAQETGISKYHFHRLFLIMFGVNIYEYIILLRLRSAAKKLKYSADNITTIALDCGYSSSQSFSKAFKAYFDQTPSEFRIRPDIKRFTNISRKLLNVESVAMENPVSSIQIVDFKETKIASLRHVGKPQDLYTSINKFINWRHGQHLHPANYNTYNVFHNPLSAEEYDIELGCEYSPEAKLLNGVAFSQIPECKCASLTYFGSPDDIEIPATNLYVWAIENGFEIADFPLFCRRVSFPPFVAEDLSETIIFLPLK